MSQLSAPTITATLASNGTDILISGITSPNASGYKVRWGTLAGYGREEEITPTSGSWTIDDTFARTVYYIAVKAVGDGSEYTDSEWSNECVVVTEGTVDETLTAPTIYVQTSSYKWVSFRGLSSRTKTFYYRYQVASTSDGFDGQQPRLAFIGSVSSFDSSLKYLFVPVEPGQTFYIRVCKIFGKKAGPWSTPISATALSTSSTTVVTSSADSGTGSLREALTNATDGTLITFDAALDGATITLSSTLTSTANVVIDARSLTNGLTLDGQLTYRIWSGEKLWWCGVTFKNSGGNDAWLKGGIFDCVVDTVAMTAPISYKTIIFNSTLKDVVTSSQNGCNNGSLLVDSVLDTCEGSGGTGAGGAYQSCLINCYLYDCKATGQNGSGGGCTGSDVFHCVFDGCKAKAAGGGVSGSTNAYCSYFARCYSEATGGWSSCSFSSSLVDCRITNITAASRDCVFRNDSLTRCIITNCVVPGTGSSWMNGGCLTYTCGLTNCRISGCTSTYGVILVNNQKMRGCLVYDNHDNNGNPIDVTLVSGYPNYIYDSTIGAIVFSSTTTDTGYIYNTLYKSWTTAPTGANANNLCYDGLESTYFLDSANGNYHLKPGSPAIGAGDNQYVSSGELDLDGNTRILGTNVDVGAYGYVPTKVATPTFALSTGAGGTATINYTLPAGASGCTVGYAPITSGGTGTFEYITDAPNPCVISGLDGRYGFMVKATSPDGASYDSDWTTLQEATLDATPPTVTAVINPATNDTVWRFTPELLAPNSTPVSYFFTISDNVDPSPSYHWYIYDVNNTLVDDGTGGYIPIETLPVAARYRIDLTATDTAGNTASATCTAVIACNRPTYTYSVGPGGTLTITYTLPQGADGADVRYKTSGGSWTTETGVNNPCVIAGLDGTYDWQMRVTSTSDELLRSAYTLTETVTLDAYPPVLTIPETAVDLTVGASVDLMTGVSATDNQTANPTIHYTITDAQGQTVVIGGQTEDLQTEDLDPGVYTIIYAASDATGNVATAERALKVRLAAPTYTITTGAGGTATLAFTLPEGATGCDILPLSSESFNPPVWIEGATNPCILTGLNGPYYFYLKSVSPTGQYNSNNVRSSLYWLDAVTPTVTVEDKTRLEYVVGDTTVNLLAGVTATDDHDATVPLIYYLTDANNEIVDVDGQREDIPSEDIPIGAFTIVYEATDSAGNKGYNDRPLLVLPTVLETPTIACVGLYNATTTISGLDVENAYGYDIEVDGAVRETIDPPTSGTYAIANLTDNAAHTIRAKALGDWEEPVGHYRDSGWSNTVEVIIGNPAQDNAPVITREQVTDRSITIGVSEYETSAGYFEILLSEDKGFSSPITLTKVPADEITIKGLKASTIYYLKLRAVFSESITPWSNVLLFQTQDLGPITPADKLLYIRERIAALRGYLADISNIDSVSIDGISESKYDREKLLKELADLEAEEARLANGGGRLRTMNIRWTIR